MNRREMLSSGIRQLAQTLPKLVSQGRLDKLLTGGVSAPPPTEVSSFPKKALEPAQEEQNSFTED